MFIFTYCIFCITTYLIRAIKCCNRNDLAKRILSSNYKLLLLLESFAANDTSIVRFGHRIILENWTRPKLNQL